MQTPFHLFIDGNERVFWVYLASSLVIALLLTWFQGEAASKTRWKRYFWNQDTRLDFVYFFFNWLVRTVLIAPVILSAQTVAVWTLDALQLIADPLFLPWRYRHIVLAYTVALFLAGDLSRYWLHRLMHRNRWLWLFHKVHHSATALNPLTFYRLHPVESLLFALRHALVAGGITGLFIFYFGARLDIYTIFGSNLLMVCLFEFTSNLRHSHIRLSYGFWLEHVVISPLQHQIHHDRRHLQTNFGSALALWDWLFGTLRLPKHVPATHDYGLGEQANRQYRSVVALVVQPFIEFNATLWRDRR